MWGSITVENFQSIKRANINLGALTVIVGPSSSGKSAFLRSIKTLVSNARGTEFMTRGAGLTKVTAETDQVAVEFARGASGGAYRLIQDGNEEVYTKLGGGVPAAVTARLRVAPADGGGALHFAAQFDRQYSSSCTW